MIICFGKQLGKESKEVIIVRGNSCTNDLLISIFILELYYRIYMKKQKVSFQQELLKREKPQPSDSILWQNIQGDNCKKIVGPNRCFCKHSF